MQGELAGLFRDEVLAARRVRLDGEIVFSRPLHGEALIALLACSILGLGVAVTTGSYARTEMSRGILETNVETVKIVAAHPGIITQLSAKEGQPVRRGDVLATVQIDQQYGKGLGAAQEGLSAVNAQERLGGRQEEADKRRGRSERSGLIAMIASAREQYTNVEGQVTIQQQVVQSLEDAYERYKPIASRGFISQSQMDTREQQILSAREQLAQLQQQLITLKNSALQASAELDKSQADEDSQTIGVRSSVEQMKVQGAQLRAQQTYVLVSPVDGIVSALQSGIGRTVDASLPIMTIVPAHAVLHAEIYLPSRSVGFVRPGEEVRLLYDAFPYQHFGSFKGTIKSVSEVALDPRQVDAPLKFDEPVYKVRVDPERQTVNAYRKQMRLQPGMSLSANIVLERQSFLQWFLEPLNAVMKRDH